MSSASTILYNSNLLYQAKAGSQLLISPLKDIEKLRYMYYVLFNINVASIVNLLVHLL